MKRRYPRAIQRCARRSKPAGSEVARRATARASARSAPPPKKNAKDEPVRTIRQPRESVDPMRRQDITPLARDPRLGEPPGPLPDGDGGRRLRGARRLREVAAREIADLGDVERAGVLEEIAPQVGLGREQLEALALDLVEDADPRPLG